MKKLLFFIIICATFAILIAQNNQGTWISHTISDIVEDGWGPPTSDPYYPITAMQRFTPEQLNDLGVSGRILEKVAFAVATPGGTPNLTTFEIRVYIGGSGGPGDAELDPGELVYSRTVTGVVYSGYSVAQYNEFTLTQPIVVPYDQELWIGYHAEVNSLGRVAAVTDYNNGYDGHGYIVWRPLTGWLNGTIWQGYDENWMIRGYVAPEPVGILSGLVTHNGNPLDDVIISLNNSVFSGITNSEGIYTINNISLGTYEVTAQKVGYNTETATNIVISQDQTTTQNFQMTIAGIVTVSGKVIASDTNQGLENAEVILSGPTTYPTVFTDSQGNYIIPDVAGGSTYILTISKEKYISYENTDLIIGQNNLVVPDVVLQENPLPATNVFTYNEGNQARITWQRSGDLRSPSRSGDLRTPFIPIGDQRYGTGDLRSPHRIFLGYTLHRASIDHLDTPSLWTEIATNITSTEYIDPTWGAVEKGAFRYIVTAEYSNNVFSEPAFSENIIHVNMTSNVTIDIITYDEKSPNGALLTLRNNSNDENHVYETIVVNDSVNFPEVWQGTYTLTIFHDNYATYYNNNVEIITDPFVMIAGLGESLIWLYEDFEDVTVNSFPPADWTLIDGGLPNYTWKLWNQAAYDIEDPLGLDLGILANSGVQSINAQTYTNISDDPDYGMIILPVDDYIILPQLEIPEDVTSVTLEYYIWTMLWNYPNETYSIVVSTTTPTASAFTPIYTNTFTRFDNSPTLTLHDLSDYIGQTIYVGFWHHTQEDMMGIVIDDVKVELGFRHIVSENNFSVTPIVSSLKGNYPNPFNPSTTIHFDMAKEGDVLIEIYNIRGQKVKTLVDSKFGVGNHKIEWNGIDDNNRNLASGVYFYNFKTNGVNTTKRMVLMK